MASLSRDAILGQFDRLQKEGELFYNPTQPQRVVGEGLEFEFRIVPSFTTKPQLSPNASTPNTAQPSHRPPPTDGSDIDHADPAFFVAYVNKSGAPPSVSTSIADDARSFTHKLILNKFCVFRPQYILLTTDPLQRQTSRLDEADLRATWTVLGPLEAQRKCYVIFNCGREGGSSRLHKHLQVLECPGEGERALMWPHLIAKRDGDRDVKGSNGGLETLPLPFLAYKTDLQAGRRGSEDAEYVAELVQVYQAQYKAAAAALGRDEAEDFPHNVILTRDWTVLIPRTKATVEGLEGHVVNATGMMGLVWCGNEAQLEGWKKVGPEKVLAQLGLARK